MTAAHCGPIGSNNKRVKFKHFQTLSINTTFSEALRCVLVCQRGRGMLDTHIASLGPTCCAQTNTKDPQNFRLCTHVSQTHSHADPPSLPLTLSFTLTSPLFLTHSHPTRPARLPPKKKKPHHHHLLPSCRKFLMISIIRVRAVSPAKSEHTHANTHTHTQQTGTQSIQMNRESNA